MKPRPPSSALPHVAVCVDQFRSHGRGVLRGIAQYVENYGPWSLYVDPTGDSRFPNGRSEHWRGDGILTYVEDPRRALRLRQRGIPTVELFAYRDDHLLPIVAHDDLAVGRCAAEHLLARHFRSFAFSGYAGVLWSDRRREGFSKAVTEAGCAPPDSLCIARPETLPEWEQAQQRLIGWVRQLPKPVAVMACSDEQGQRVLDACHRAKMLLPEEVSVIGVDDDMELCRLSDPALSSVILDSEKVGYEGARLLDGLMRGPRRQPSDQRLAIPPLGIATRRSTDASAIPDLLVARAARSIRDRACEGIDVDDLIRELNISRSAFYQRFRDAMKRSPHAEILRVQLDRVKTLLLRTSLPLKTIAEMSGFDNANYLSVVFKRETGVTPRQYRRRQLTSSTGRDPVAGRLPEH